ncbi:hypothetical protein A2U01_0078102, partial [Trifolium medium]|nr:hypothetical protein [Trifolium medium]
GKRCEAGRTESDSIHESDTSSSSTEQCVVGTNHVGINLEVVLQCNPGQNEDLADLAGGVVSGVNLLLQNDDEGGVQSRQEVEATKLIALAED